MSDEYNNTVVCKPHAFSALHRDSHTSPIFQQRNIAYTAGSMFESPYNGSWISDSNLYFNASDGIVVTCDTVTRGIVGLYVFMLVADYLIV